MKYYNKTMIYLRSEAAFIWVTRWHRRTINLETLNRDSQQKMIQEQKNAPAKNEGSNFMGWKWILSVVVFLAVKQLFTYKHKQEAQKPFDVVAVANQIRPQIQNSDLSHYAYAKKILLEEMTPLEKEYYFKVTRKILRNAATHQDLENLGLLYNRIIKRLNGDKKAAVEDFFRESRNKFGDPVQNQMGRQ